MHVDVKGETCRQSSRIIGHDYDGCFYNGQSKADTFIQDTRLITGLGARSPSTSSTA